MDFERLNGDIKEMRRRNRGLGLAVGVLAAGQILALVVILNLLGTVRTVVVPPSIDKTFWVTRDKASNEYLEQMGSFIAWLVLDVTPASIDWKKEILLGYVEPEQYGPLKTRQEVEASAGRRIAPAVGTFDHVAAGLAQQAGARAILCPAQGDAGSGQLVELELGVGVPVGGRTLKVQQQLVLVPPHRFAAARRLGRAKDQFGSEKPEDVLRLLSTLPCSDSIPG